jgi:transcriptional regulator with XRE-family HTH domain
MEREHGDGRLREFLLETCRSRGLSLRRLSFDSGLSPGTVYSIINRKFQPTLYSLNKLADYLGVKREYLWHLAGLTEGSESVPGDTRLKPLLARAEGLPEEIRDRVITCIEHILTLAEKAGGNTQQ